ncbi:MAG: NAD(P)/FAD-dependent oxidoreductase [Xanthobacteraceae bacterium]|nr:NAD(P)/FAD-dependent oxidoreductase [Xanthobacteraceae bacterium]MCW5674063.1 NAD(P)/FAD-dependent oxidoreductase [Xanthobacteraceae bacterium]
MSWDGIIIGAGHNALVLQAYLGKAGLKILSIDRRHIAGGGLATMEDPRRPGFLHNTHAFFQRAITNMPWYADLELERHGAKYIEPELNVAMIMSDERSLEWWTDIGRTVASFEKFSKKDAETLKRWQSDFVPIVRDILSCEAKSPPLPKNERRALLEKSASGRRLLEVSALSPLEFVHQEFEHPAVKAGLLFFNGLREVDLRVKGFGHHIAALLASPAKAQMSRGGTAALARALENAVYESGGEIRLLTEPARILIENGKAVGVETREGELLRAKNFVASALNPQQTFLDLLDETLVPREIRDLASRFQYNLLAPLFALHLNLSEAPQYAAAKNNPALAKAFMVIMGLDHVDQFGDIVRHHEAGTVPDTVMWGATPSLFDPTQAPAGRHAAFMWEKLPYHLHGDPASWDAYKDKHGEKMLALWRRHAPNLEGAVIDAFTRSPLDVERELPNMREADLLIGAFTNGQIGHDRPFPGAGSYRAHIPNLYLCGSSSHPGGNVTGLPGYNAAQVILADLGIRAGWAPPPISDRLKALH